jgi:thiosulfate dehydrogenase (quinone) large subunit
VTPMSHGRGVALVALRTVVGWHFLYEGYFKLLVPGWSRAGAPLAAWSSGGYLQASTGPFAAVFHALGSPGHSGWMTGVVDLLVPVGLLAVGMSLMLGLFTQAGVWTAAFFLTLFYLASIPTSGVPAPSAEGAYLLVNKTLVELAAVIVLATFRTGEIAGLDLLRRRA